MDDWLCIRRVDSLIPEGMLFLAVQGREMVSKTGLLRHLECTRRGVFCPMHVTLRVLFGL
jgi:hypothetical protein